MKFINFYKKALIIIFVTTILLFPLNNIFADEITDTIINTNINTTLFSIAPPLWLAATGLKMATDFGCELNNLNNCIPNSIITAVGSMFGATVVTFMGFAEEILTMATSSSDVFGFGFIPESNPYVSEGWNIVRNLANAVLVLGLVVIAISIILGNQENKAKRLLINFIIIALLINFTPVICGLIIDGSNIITSSMLTGGINNSYSKTISNMLQAGIAGQTKEPMMVFAYTFIVSLFCIFAIVIFFLYAILFIARTIVLWILVIISPIAFATFIIKDMPQSKYIRKIFPSVTFWDDWWESFIQWCVIGIPAGFSLFISNKLLVAMAGVEIPSGDPVLGTLAAYMLPFIFLIVGFFITISSGGHVGSFVGGVATGAWAATGGKALGRIKDTAKAGGEWMYDGGKRTAAGFAVGGLSGISQGYSDSGLKGAVLGGATGAAMGATGAEGREKAAKKIAEIKENIGFTKRGEYDGKLGGDVEEAQKRLDNLSDDDLRKITTSGAETRSANIEKSAAFNALNKRGKLGDSELEYLAGNKKWAETFNVKLKDISKSRPEYASKLVGKDSFSVVGGMTPAEAGKTINSKSFASPEILSSLTKQTIKGKLDKGTAEDLKNIKEGFTGLLQEMNTFSSNIVLPEDLEKLVTNNLNEIEKETQLMISSGDPEKVRKANTIRGLINAQKQRRI